MTETFADLTAVGLSIRERGVAEEECLSYKDSSGNQYYLVGEFTSEAGILPPGSSAPLIWELDE